MTNMSTDTRAARTTYTVTAYEDDGTRYGYPGERVVRGQAADGQTLWCPGNHDIGETFDSRVRP